MKGGDWIFELNKIQGELKFFKIKGGRGRKRGGQGEFLKFHWGGGSAGDEILNRKQNF